jgi:hypothetical protein
MIQSSDSGAAAARHQKCGKALIDADIEQLADEAATTDYAVEALRRRR